MNTVVTKKNGVDFGSVRWAKWQIEFLAEYDIATVFLPVSRKQAFTDGWFDGSKKKVAQLPALDINDTP